MIRVKPKLCQVNLKKGTITVPPGEKEVVQNIGNQYAKARNKSSNRSIITHDFSMIDGSISHYEVDDYGYFLEKNPQKLKICEYGLRVVYILYHLWPRLQQLFRYFSFIHIFLF